MDANETFETWQFRQSEPPTKRGDCPGCSHPKHAVYACQGRPLFTQEGRCGCDSNYGDVPAKWLT